MLIKVLNPKIKAMLIPIAIAWGANKNLLEIKTAIYKNVILPTKRTIVGWKTQNYQYYHPWPRERNEIRKEWPNNIFKELKNSNA